MTTFFIGVVVLLCAAGFLWLAFGKTDQQEATKRQELIEPLLAFSRQHGFETLPDVEKNSVWTTLKGYIPAGPVRSAFTSTRDPDPELIAAGTIQNSRAYALLKQSVHHQSSGRKRYTAGLFLERPMLSGELLAARQSAMNAVSVLGSDWQQVAQVGDSIAYARTGTMNPEKIDQILGILGRFSDSPLTAVFKPDGFLVYTEKVGEAPRSAKEYERLRQAADALLQEI